MASLFCSNSKPNSEDDNYYISSVRAGETRAIVELKKRLEERDKGIEAVKKSAAR
jgi:hypothetical protein